MWFPNNNSKNNSNIDWSQALSIGGDGASHRPYDAVNAPGELSMEHNNVGSSAPKKQRRGCSLSTFAAATNEMETQLLFDATTTTGTTTVTMGATQVNTDREVLYSTTGGCTIGGGGGASRRFPSWRPSGNSCFTQNYCPPRDPSLGALRSGGSGCAMNHPQHHLQQQLPSPVPHNLQRQQIMANLMGPSMGGGGQQVVPSWSNTNVDHAALAASALLLLQSPPSPPLTSQERLNSMMSTTTELSPAVSHYLLLNAIQRMQQQQGHHSDGGLFQGCSVLSGMPGSDLNHQLSGQKRLLVGQGDNIQGTNDASVVSASMMIPRSRSSPHVGSVPLLLPAPLACAMDATRLSVLQTLLREQIEVFEATQDDISTHIRGRNKSIQFRQVGIRCRHCACIPVIRRAKGSTYYPTSVWGLYQASQNMCHMHFASGLCTQVPPTIQAQFTQLVHRPLGDSAAGTTASKGSPMSSSGAGRKYWAETAQQQLGLVDTVDGIFFIRHLPRNVQFPDRSTSTDNNPGVYRKTSTQHKKKKSSSALFSS